MLICTRCGKEVDTVYFHRKEEVCENCLRLIKENEEAAEEAPGSSSGIKPAISKSEEGNQGHSEYKAI